MHLDTDALPVIASSTAAVAGILFGAGTLFYTRKRQGNDDVETMIAVKDATITALEKHNELLEQTIAENRAAGERREQEWREREAEWKEERAEYRSRIDRLERDYRTLLERLTLSGVCDVANTCINRVVPGDRRTEPADGIKPGGTDSE